MLRKTDALLAKKCQTASGAPHLNTKALIQTLDEVAKAVDLDVSTILEEQMKDTVLSKFHIVHWKLGPPAPKSTPLSYSEQRHFPLPTAH